MTYRWTIALAAAVASGCYSFSDSSIAAPGETARVTLALETPVGGGREGPTRVEGTVVASSLAVEPGPGSSILLEQRTKQPNGNFGELVLVDTTLVLQPDVERLEVRRFSWIRSGAGAIGLGFLAHALISKFRPSFEGR